MLAGRRIDAADSAGRRFPLSRVADVAIELHALFRRYRATTLVSAAACGADLVALVAARSLGMRRRIVLPSSPRNFRKESVVDRPGEWGPLYDELIAEARASGDLVVLEGRGKRANPFAAANERLIKEAIQVSGKPTKNRVGRSRLLAVVVWEGRRRGVDDYTQDFAERARANAISVEVVLTN